VLTRLLSAGLIAASFLGTVAVADPGAETRARFDQLATHFDSRKKQDAAGLRADLLAIDRAALDDDRWIDLHIGLMKLAEHTDAPRRGLPEGTTAPAATSSDPFDQKCDRQRLRPFGEAAYAHKLRTTHGLDMSTMRVLRMGRRAREAVAAELVAFAAEHGGGRTWREMAEHEQANRPADDADLKARYDAFSDESERFVIDRGLVTVPEDALGVRVRLVRRFGYPYAIYQPSVRAENGKIGGVVMGRRPEDLDARESAAWYGEFNDHFMRMVAVHEGVPGHHLQFRWAAKARKGLRRHGYNSVYVEGWGLYTEGLMERHGYVTGTLDRLAALRMRAWRAVRCYVDPALHSGLIRPSEAVRLLVDEAGASERAAKMEITRYLRDPTQPIGYWVGRRHIEKMRAAYIARHGEDAEREFHDRLLGLGCIPLPLAEAVLLDQRTTYDHSH
jgi:uncharacterized protein (DUF885 family)